MKKQLLILSLATLSLMGTAQAPRLVLYEEFTGENCGPCAQYNPDLNTLLLSNPTKVIPIKWQVNIPSAPTNTWSLWQTNQTEIQWRKTTYGYGVSSAPEARIDGQNCSVFGASTNHVAYTSQAVLNNAAAVTSPFTINMLRSWDAGMTVFTVSVTITAAQTYTCAGPLLFRMVMVEKAIHWATAPGTNGEKDFYYAVRKSFPTIQSGTSLPTSWTTGQTQTFTIACTAPSYIVNKLEVECVGFIQDDATKKVQQAGVTKAPNDAQAGGLVSSYYNCSTPFTPAVNISNVGVNTISTMTIIPVVDGIAGTPYAWSGSILSGASATVNMPSISPSAAAHTYSYNISAVNGTTDDYPSNNTKLGSFAISNTIIPAPILQPFTTTTFPPANWYRNNQDNGTYQFSRWPTISAYGISPFGCVKYDSWNNPILGDRDELYMPDADFTGLSNMNLTFDVAHSQVVGKAEGLDVLVSTNCGVTWTNVYSKYGSVLATAPASTVQFIPASAQWRSEVVNLGAYNNMSNVLVKFMVYNATGNTIWLDNINLVSTTGLKSTVSEFDAVDLFPNPAQTQASVRITTPKGGDFTIVFLNTLGQMVEQKTLSMMGSGSEIVNFDTKSLASGIYYVVVSDKEGKTTTKKLIINK